MTARAERRWDGGYVLTFPYDPYLIEALKREIPAHAREYDPTLKAWTVGPVYAAVALELLRAIFPDAEIDGSGAGQRDAAGDAWAVLHLRPTAPPQLVEAAYRCLARLHHPDAGGDHEQMQALNQAVETIRESA